MEKYIKESKEIIHEALQHSKNPAVACSFGRCSVTTLHLVLEQKSDVLVVFCNTGVEYPQILKLKEQLKKDWNLNLVETHYYKKSFWMCIDDYGIPSYKSAKGKSFPKCCYYLKEKPATIVYKRHAVDLVFTGLRSEESRNRFLLLEYGLRNRHKYDNPLLYYSNKVKIWRCHPIAHWKQGLLDSYIEQHNIPISDVYKPPFNLKRVGCMPCTSYIGWKKTLARVNPKLLKILLGKQGQTQLQFDCGGEIIR